MSRRLEGRVALVVGAGSIAPGLGNGKAAAIQLAREGAAVALVDINAAAAEETRSLVAAEGGDAITIEGDVALKADVERMVADCIARFGRLDILLNNVGITSRKAFLDETPDTWDRVMAVNLKGPFMTTQAVVPQMLRQGSGRIINVSSIAAIRYASRPVSFSYGASKAALLQLTRMTALEFADRGIRCNAIVPGLIDTPLVREVSGDRAEDVARQRAAISPTGSQGTAWDIAHAVSYLAGDESGFVNGIELVVDGGLSGATPRGYGSWRR